MPKDEDLDVLQNLEFAIVGVWREHREMTDYNALRAYEAARLFYRAEQRGQPPKTPDLTGLDATAFEAVRSMCEFRLGRVAHSTLSQEPAPAAVPLEQLVGCLQTLTKSVERNTKRGGRQGYLQFIDGFLP